VVTDTGTALRDGALRIVNAPAPIEVRTGADGKPQSVRIGRRWRRVSSITNRWRLGPDEWWTERPVDRWYFAVRLDDDRPLTVFRDQVTSLWYIQRA